MRKAGQYHLAYLKVLAVLYLVGSCLHVLDLLDLRLKFSEMNALWKTWIVYLTLADFLAALGLWRGTQVGELLFILIALSQLAVYIGWSSHLGNQTTLIVFHAVTLTGYFLVLRLKARSEYRATIEG